MHGIESRKYRILGVLGIGGFGTVYRARLEGEQGFVKEIALKMLTSHDVSDETLARFRDEARILGLVRDRAIVTVDSPTRINGNWAVVMEFVAGASCARLGRGGAVFPPGVAVEIIGEVARALNTVYHQHGPSGEPLKLLHRDLKPGNIQVTPSGEVKVLDFGIARAEFENREAKTTSHIAGTPGYIAPERLYGQEGPEGDVFSLGVVLHKLLTSKMPPKHWLRRETTEDVVEPAPTGTKGFILALDLSKWMLNASPRIRPTARETEEECHEIRACCKEDPRLRNWAELQIPKLSEMAPDALVGELITETMRGVPLAPDDLVRDVTAESQIFSVATRGALVAAGAAGGTSLFLVGGALGAVFVAAGALLLSGMPEPDSTAVLPIAVTVEKSDALVGKASSDSADVEPLPTAMQEPAAPPNEPPAIAPVQSAPDVQPKLAAPVTLTPAKVPPKPAPSAPVAAKFRAVTFTSIPMDAEVWVDGKRVGTTPLPGLELSDGAHTIVMVYRETRIRRAIRVGRRSPSRHVWKVEESKWESGF